MDSNATHAAAHQAWMIAKANKKKRIVLLTHTGCLQVSMGYIDIKTYAKNCMPKATCDNSDVFSKECKAASCDTCSLDCCEGNLCNGDTVPMVSVLLMVACALMALFC